MKSFGIDFHTILGAGGLLATFTFSDANKFIACLVGLATLAYMLYKAARERLKFKREQKKENENEN